MGPWIARRKAAAQQEPGQGGAAEKRETREKAEKKRDAKQEAKERLHVRTDELELAGLTKKVIYRERVFARVPFAFCSLAAVGSGVLAASVEPSSPQTAAVRSTLVFLMVLFFFLLVNFSTLSIRITFSDIVVRFGLFNFQADWEDVSGMDSVRERDGAGNLYGIRMKTLPDGTWRIIYSAGLPRVILKLKEGAIRELAFTTMAPEKVLTVASECKRRKEAQSAKKTIR
ncbi:MAG: hypothetical protein ACP5DY_07020 [Thermovirgaceae bacterium]